MSRASGARSPHILAPSDRFEADLIGAADILRSLPEASAGPGSLVTAVDLGGTKIRAVVAEPPGRGVIGDATVPTDPGCRWDDQVAAVCRTLWSRVARRADGTVVAVGIPAVYDAAQDRAWRAPNVPDLETSRPRAQLERRLGHPVVVLQDTRLAAVAERWRGGAAEVDDYVVVCVGTGVSMGIVIGGRLYGGGRGEAGEIGGLPIGGNPFAPRHRRHGAFENAVSGSALARSYRRFARGPAAGSGEQIVEAATRGEEPARRAVEQLARTLALGIAAVSATLDPALVVLGGGVGANPALEAPIRAALLALMDRPPEVARSPLGADGPVIGAIVAAWTAARGLASTGVGPPASAG
jgi:predicted NBD/HSP70 family sugar kinase